LNGFEDVRSENGPRQCQNLTLTDMFSQSLLDSGQSAQPCVTLALSTVAIIISREGGRLGDFVLVQVQVSRACSSMSPLGKSGVDFHESHPGVDFSKSHTGVDFNDALGR